MKPSSKGRPSGYQAFAQAELFTPARMAADAWARTYTREDSADVYETRRDGLMVTVVTTQGTDSLLFDDETSAARAVKIIPVINSSQRPFGLAASLDLVELNRQMNFGRDPQETAPVSALSRVPALG